MLYDTRPCVYQHFQLQNIVEDLLSVYQQSVESYVYDLL